MSTLILNHAHLVCGKQHLRPRLIIQLHPVVDTSDLFFQNFSPAQTVLFFLLLISLKSIHHVSVFLALHDKI